MNESTKKILREFNTFFKIFLFPPFFYVLFLNLLDKSLLFFSRKKGNFINLSDLKKKERLFILGNGPSIKHFNLKSIADEDFISMNFFYKHDFYEVLSPFIHIMADPVKKNYTKQAAIEKENLLNVIKKMEGPFLFHESTKIYKNEFPKNKTFFFFDSLFSSIDISREKNFDFSTRIPRPRNSVQLALMLGIFIGYKEILILGADEDQLVNKESFNHHFYAMTENEIKKESSNLTYRERLQGKTKTFKGYETILRAAKAKKISIYNLNPSSYLDTFEFKQINFKKNEK